MQIPAVVVEMDDSSGCLTMPRARGPPVDNHSLSSVDGIIVGFAVKFSATRAVPKRWMVVH
jgi:hypothetical protein